MANIDLTQGSLLIGTFFNLVLYTIECICIYSYCSSRRFQSDLKIAKYPVFIAFISDSVGTFGTLATSYLLSINYSRSNISILAPIWSLSVWLLCNAISVYLTRLFMARRLWILSRQIVLCSSIFLMVNAAFVFTILTDVMTLAKRRNLTTRRDDLYLVVTSLAIGCLVDMIISLGLLWELRPSAVTSHSAKRLTRRLSWMIIPSGSVAFILGLSQLIAFVALPATRVSTGIGFVGGRVYTMTMLFTLIYRDRISGRGVSTSALPMHISIEMHTSQITDIDPPLTPPPASHVHTK